MARAFKYSFGGAVACRFLVVYNYGENVQGKGKYLSEVAIIPTGDVHVAFGYTLDMQARVRSVVNEGSDKAPVAAMQLAVSFSSSTSFANFPHHRLYYINGAGEFQDLTNGNLN
ncbi:MAG: hypothetical protein H7222_15790 [Methylotenera sp.]|nr:hypothetical protein [Oligoflexia bacterium]